MVVFEHNQQKTTITSNFQVWMTKEDVCGITYGVGVDSIEAANSI